MYKSLSTWVMFAFVAVVAHATPPNTPAVTSPPSDGAIVNGADVHMETTPFSDPDIGDTHLNSDWQIWTVGAGSNIVWIESAAIGTDKLHTHLGEGSFTNALAGKTQLAYDTDYRLKVRHRDNASAVSAFAERFFHTAPATALQPLLLEDVASTPVWINSIGANVILPSAGMTVRLESTNAELLVQFQGANGVTNVLNNPPALPTDRIARLVVSASGGTLSLPESTIDFFDEHGAHHTLYLPALNVASSSNAFFAIAANGSTYYGSNFANLARSTPVPWTVFQPGFQVDVAATGFQFPIALTFVPSPGSQTNSPYLYVAELYGQIKVVTRDGTVRDYATNLLNFNPTGQFPGSGELGLCGLVVDPSTGDVLAGLIYSSIPGNDSANKYPRVIRLHSTDGGLSASSTNTVLDMPGETQGPAHQISNLTIGPDGKLYVHVGDGMNTPTAQNLNSFQGKILRLNLDGTPASDNPFFDASNGTNSADYVFAYGFRNPFGGDWRALDASHYEVENGPNTDRFARVVSGRNYLWNGSDASMTNYAIYNWGGATAPVHIQFITGNGFPANKMDHAFVSEAGATYATGPQATGKRIEEFVLDASGNLLSGPIPFLQYNGSGKATAAGMIAGPDGLYFTDLYKDASSNPLDRGANVLRIKFVGTADFVASMTGGKAPLNIQFTDTSNVPSPTGWLWDFGDGGTSTSQNPSHTYVADGSYNVRLTVTGVNGQSITQKNAYIVVASVVSEIGGVVVLEAEDAFNNISRSSHDWVFTNAPAGFSGTGAMQALPDNGANITNNVETTSPELQYKVNLNAAGQRFVWVRGYATSGTDDSVHVGVGGAATTATNIVFVNSYNAWVWTNKNAAGNSPTITASAGTNTVSVWMREDGFRLDRILLTTNAAFSATLGNVFHIPNNTADLGFTMRTPFSGMTPDLAVTLYTGNQFKGGGNAGNQLQTGSAVFYRHATNTTWSSQPMNFYAIGTQGSTTNNKYFVTSIPGGLFNGGDTVQYYFKIPYDDHVPTFIYGNDAARFNTEIESVAQAGAFSFTYSQSLQPSGPYVAITNAPSGAEGRIYLNTGHIALGTNVVFLPPSANTGNGLTTIGGVLSSSNILNGVQVRQAFGSTSIVAQLTFPYDGVMRYEVVNWGGQVVSATAITAASDASEHFYGFGEKFNEFDQAGKKVQMLTWDPAGNKGDRSYKVAPWFISSKGYGFHLDATTESFFDMRASYGDRYVISNFVASSFSGYVTNALKFNVVAGPKLTDVLTRYTGYTGRPALPPKWAFAPWMSSDIWHDGGEVRYLITKYRQLGIPGSSLVFDSPWEVAYNDFQWNTNQWKVGNTYEGTFYNGFNTTSDMMTFLRTNGFYVVCWMTPFVDTSSLNPEGVPELNTGQAANYAEGAASNYFVRASVGGPPLMVNWWKGTGSPIDFTNPNAVKWAQKQLSNLVAQSGGVIAGFKTDDGETSNGGNTYIPTTGVYFDGRTGIEMRNGYCVEYHKSIWNVLGTNGLLFARSGFTGSQAYPGYWAGDNEPNFGESNGLPSVVIASQSSAMSGFSIWASDVGGYQNTQFSSSLTNLFIRWTQFGAFSPLMQMHRKTDNANVSYYPWGFGAAALTNYLTYAKLHTSLFPYLYTYALEGSTNGLPIMRPLVLMYPNDANVLGIKHTFLFGNELLVSPVITNNATTRQIYLPTGKWYDYFSNVRYTGGQTITWNNADQSQMPLFVREGGIIPMISSNVMTLCDAAYVGNPNIPTMTSALEFLVYPGTNSSFKVYDGTTLSVQSNGTVVTATLTSQPRAVTLRFRAAPAAGVERDGVRLTTFTNVNGFVQVTFDHSGGSTQIRFGPDTDSDGIPDSWATYWFGNPNVCASCDDDGDGLSNLQEYLAGTSPTDGENFLRVTSFQPGTLNFASVNGMKYRVEKCDDISNPFCWTTLQDNIVGTGGIMQINDSDLTGVIQRFYRVRLLSP